MKTKTGKTIFLQPDGCWFQFADDDDDGDPMRPVVSPSEQEYAYSHGGAEYRAAIEAIAEWKAANGWGGE